MKTVSKPSNFTKSSVKIVIADDHDIFRHGLMDVITTCPDYQVVASCKNGKELIEAARKYRPAIIITDLKMPNISGIEAIDIIRKDHPQIRCIALTQFDNEYMIASALEVGIIAYLTKGIKKEELFQAIDSVRNNSSFYCKSTSHKLALMVTKGNFNPFSKKSKTLFSKTEKDMIRLICEDKNCKEIAQILSLSVRTVENYRSKIFRKMNVNSSAGMTVYAIKNALFKYED